MILPDVYDEFFDQQTPAHLSEVTLDEVGLLVGKYLDHIAVEMPVWNKEHNKCEKMLVPIGHCDYTYSVYNEGVVDWEWETERPMLVLQRIAPNNADDLLKAVQASQVTDDS